jgi:peptide deformylase
MAFMPTFDLDAWLALASSPAAIVQAGAAVLRRRATNVDPSWLGTPAWAALIERMVGTMRAAPGVGLAAPQIGVPWRVFVAEDLAERIAVLSPENRASRGRVPLPLLVVVNPALTLGDGDAIFYEGCLSVRGYGALVRRAAHVEVTGLDAFGQPLSIRLSGWPARIVQHEVDHLDGTLYVDRMVSRSLACDADLGRLAALPPDDVLRELDGATEESRHLGMEWAERDSNPRPTD